MESVKCYFIFLASICVPLAVVKSQFVKVDPKVTAYLGGEVIIRCEFILEASTAKIVQVEWRKEPSASAFAVFHPEFGKTYTASSLEGRVHFTSSHVNDASIRISNVNETDEGGYTCAYTTYPGGSYIATTTLTVREQPLQISTAAASGIVTALLLLVLTAAAVCFTMKKRRQRCDPPKASGSSSSNQAAPVTEREDEDVNYAEICLPRPAQGHSAVIQSMEGTVYAEVKQNDQLGSQQLFTGGRHGLEEVGETTYAQVKKLTSAGVNC